MVLWGSSAGFHCARGVGASSLVRGKGTRSSCAVDMLGRLGCMDVMWTGGDDGNETERSLPPRQYWGSRLTDHLELLHARSGQSGRAEAIHANLTRSPSAAPSLQPAVPHATYGIIYMNTRVDGGVRGLC